MVSPFRQKRLYLVSPPQLAQDAQVLAVLRAAGGLLDPGLGACECSIAPSRRRASQL